MTGGHVAERTGGYGVATPRLEARSKVTGQARYGSDFDGGREPAHARLVTSGIALGRITGIEEAAARAVPGVLEILTWRNAGPATLALADGALCGPGDTREPLDEAIQRAAIGAGQLERALPSIAQLIASWPNTPAFVQNRHMDVLAANALASALSPVFSPGVNLVRATFLDPEVRRLSGDWDSAARTAVGRLRALAGPDVEDPRLVELVGELSVRSDRFRRLWARHDIEVTAVPARTIHHPIVGSLELQAEWLAITSAEGQFLVVYHAAPGSPSEQALTRLAGLVSC
jgi:hypothetical protein